MIVVIGVPLYRASEAGEEADGFAARVALAATAGGRIVQLVGKAGEDEAGEAVVLALARGGVGHAALLRQAGWPTPRVRGSVGDDGDAPDDQALRSSSDRVRLEAADVDLALRYLTEFRVLVLADPPTTDLVGVAAAAANWADARLIIIVLAGDTAPGGISADAIVIEAPDADPDGVFASMVGSFAAALDDGGDPAEAFRASVESSGWTPVPED